MTVPREIFDFFIEPIRTMDRREGHDFLRRWLSGLQEVWKRTDSNVISLLNIWSIEYCPDELLKYLKWIVGWTPELDAITRDLSFLELRRLISVSAMLWKERGSEPAIVDIMFFVLASRANIWDWFDFRWVLSETAFGEEFEGHDPWLIELPDPSVWGAGIEKTERLSCLRIVDNGSLNRELVVNLLKLMRATGERWEIIYLAFLDLFDVPGADVQWTKDHAPSLIVADNVMALSTVDDDEWTISISDLGLLQGSYSARVRMADTSEELGFYLYDDDDNELYYLGIQPTYSDQVAYLYLLRSVGGGPLEALYGTYLPGFPILENVYYTYRLTMADEVDGRIRLKLFIDGNEIFDVVDDQFIPGGGGAPVVWTEEQPAGPGGQNWNGVDIGGDASPVILAATDGGRLWKGTLTGSVISWEEVYPYGDFDNYYFSCAVGYDGLTMLESSYTAIPTLSLNGGTTWSALPTFPAGDANWSVAIGGDNLTFLAVAFGQTPQVSTNRGTSWADTPIAGLYGEAWNGCAVGRNPLVMSAVTASRAYFTTDGWATFQELRPLGDVDSYWYAVSIAGDDQTILLISLDTPGIIYVTRDRGLSGWTVIDVGEADLDCAGVGADGLLALYGVYGGTLEKTNNIKASMEDLGSYAWLEITSPFPGGG